jgi:hypothetical protein
LENSKKFRELTSDECRVLLIRHVKHEKNVVPPEEASLAENIGFSLKGRVDISAVFSSPSPRAWLTAYHTMLGYSGGAPASIPTIAEMADMVSESPTLLEEMKVKTRELGLDPKIDAEIAKVVYDPKLPYLPIMARRGKEGGEALLWKAISLRGKTILVASHTVSRMEPSIQFLRKEDIRLPERLAETGQIIELIIKADISLYSWDLVEENWL